MGASGSDERGMETAEVKGLWLGGRLGGRSSTEDCRAVPKMVTGIPEEVDAANPKVPTTSSGGYLGGQLRADAGAVITRGDWKRQETDAT